MFMAALFIIAKGVSKQNVHPHFIWMDKQSVAFSYYGILFSQKYWYMLQPDEPWKYAKWKKPGAEDHILYDSIYMTCP